MEDHDELADDGDCQPPHDAAQASDPSYVLDALDLGVLVIEATTLIVHRANRAARDAMASFGKHDVVVPAMLWSLLYPIVDAARAQHGRFTAAAALVAPTKRRFFARCRMLGDSMVLVTLSAAGLREAEVRRLLADRFALSAQEGRIAWLAAQGFRNREIAERLDVVEGTVKNYLTMIFAALRVRSRTELASELHQLLEQ